MNARANILHLICRLAPFRLTGDIRIESINPEYDISCVINFYRRIHLLEGILYSLSMQDLAKDRFEVILVEDRGGTSDGIAVAERFAAVLDIKYLPLCQNHGKMGYSRNYGLSRARGKHILFLDDDTVILQKDFLSALMNVFEETESDAVIPHGFASYYLLDGRYGFHDAYFPTNRCTAYRKEALAELGGFVSDIIGQEDVEFVIRFNAAGKKAYEAEGLEYFHPPLVVDSLKKPMAVGYSFAALKNRYPFIVWLMIFLNGCRWVPLLLSPSKKHQIQGKFGFGFLAGFMKGMFGKGRISYE